MPPDGAAYQVYPGITFRLACSCAKNLDCSSAFLPSSTSIVIFHLRVLCIDRATWRPVAALRSRCGGRMSRRNETKDSATWHVGARPQSSVMRFDDRPADRQPKPQTAGLRAVESLEHAVNIRRCEAWT